MAHAICRMGGARPFRKIVIRRGCFWLQTNPRSNNLYHLCSIKDGLEAAVLTMLITEEFYGGYL